VLLTKTFALKKFVSTNFHSSIQNIFMYKFFTRSLHIREAVSTIVLLAGIIVVQAQDVLTGLTSNGGPEGKGTAFSIKSNGTSFSIIKGFADWGNTQNGNLYRHSDKNFYGMSNRGGTYGAGTIFRITSAGALTLLRSFDYANDGAYPDGELIKGHDGNLWGMTSSGGVNTYGTIFKITTGGVFTVVYSFDYTHGANPAGHLTLSGDGNYYGVARSGGASGYGAVFKMTSTGTLTVIHSFNGTTDGGYCYGSITEGTDGNLYGITYQGGTYGYGTIFKVNKTGSSFTILKSFSYATDGGYSRGDLIQATDGKFYGMTNAGGTNGGGTIFKITSTGTYTVLRNLGGNDGQGPVGNLFQNSDGFLYGMAHGGAHGGGTFFKISTAGVFTVLYSLTSATDGSDPNGGVIKSTDGNLYGLTSYDGPNFGGTAFKISTTGVFKLLTSFNGATLGNEPYESLLRGTDSAFYGTTSNGGTNQYYGTIFKICAGNTTLLHVFNGSQGGIPKGSLAEATNGALYGTTENGGTNNSGTIFKITKSGTYTVLRNLSSAADGSEPNGSLIQAKDGNLYGTNYSGGTNGGGTIFKITLTGTYTVLRSLNTADGYYPYGDLVQGTDGNFYGTTSTGGTTGAGTIFKITPAGAYTVLHNLSSVADGSNPKGSLVQHSNGNFYGMTTQGGTNGGGTIFKISSTGTFSVLKHLNPATDGKMPQGKLLIGSDGNFYGMTSAGGTKNAGTIFKITTAGTFTVLRQLDLRADGGNAYGSLIILPANSLVANTQSVVTKQDSSIKIKLTGSGGSPLTFNIVTKPRHGKLSGTGATRTYKPDSNYTGTDVFTFNVSVGCVASAAAKVNITINPVTGIFAINEGYNENALTKSQARIYPNPVSNNLTVIFNKYIGDVHATITDVRGAVIIQNELEMNGEGSAGIDVKQLKPGIYFLHLETMNGHEILKFLKL
jgi:uncharacterized repeat protein (TIGR03803 family)